jgi:predicted nucleic acid-binding protein
VICALDTNIISYLLNGNVKIAAKLETVILSGDDVIIPLMVYYEIRRGLKANDSKVKAVAFGKMCTELSVKTLTIADMDTAAEIYADRKRRGRPIEDADLLIAAQVLSRGYTLVTNNTKHFEGIEGLRLVNWAE